MLFAAGRDRPNMSRRRADIERQKSGLTAVVRRQEPPADWVIRAAPLQTRYCVASAAARTSRWNPMAASLVRVASATTLDLASKPRRAGKSLF